MSSQDIKTIAVIGFGGVGKTSLIRRLTQNTFQTKYVRTDRVHIYRISVDIGDNKNIYLDIIDTIGQRPVILSEPVFFNLSGVIIVMDLQSRVTMKLFINWLRDIENAHPDAEIALVGTHEDMVTQKDKIKSIENVMDQFPYIKYPFFRISSKTEVHDVPSPFLYMIKRFLKNDSVKIGQIEYHGVKNIDSFSCVEITKDLPKFLEINNISSTELSLEKTIFEENEDMETSAKEIVDNIVDAFKERIEWEFNYEIQEKEGDAIKVKVISKAETCGLGGKSVNIFFKHDVFRKVEFIFNDGTEALNLYLNIKASNPPDNLNLHIMCTLSRSAIVPT